MPPDPERLAAFLDAVVAEPDDELPLLQLADWLEDLGDPRGSLLRVQCELARLASADPRRPPLEREEVELLRQHGRDWAGDLPGELRVRFVAGRMTAQGGPEELLRPEAADWWGRHGSWVRRLQLRGCGDGNLARLHAAGFLSRLAELDLEHCPITDASSRLLGSLTGLRVLSLASTHITDGSLPAIARLPHLRVLDLSRTWIGDTALASLPTLRTLRELNVRGSAITPDGVRRLKGRLPALRIRS